MSTILTALLAGLAGGVLAIGILAIVVGRGMIRTVNTMAAEKVKADQVSEDPDPCAIVTVYRKERAEKGLSPAPWVEKALADLDPGPGLRPSVARTLALLDNSELVLIRDLKLRHGAS